MMDAALTQHVCLVDRILDKRISAQSGQTEYLISWQGFDSQGNEFEDTWEPESNVLGKELVQEFERSLARQPFQQKRAIKPDFGNKDVFRDPRSHYHSSRDAQNSRHSELSHHYPVSSSHPHAGPFSLSHYSSPILGNRRPIYGRAGGTTKRKSGLEGNRRTNKENIRHQPTNVSMDDHPNKRDINGSKIKILSLTQDTEKNYFSSLIEKSKLIKDEIRSDLVQFLRNPKQPGLSEASPLLKSETWLMELIDKSDRGSLCIAMDIPNGVIKAMFVPRMPNQRMTLNTGVVITDRPIVMAVMAGDASFGLGPSETTTESAVEEATRDHSALKTQSPSSLDFQEQPQKSGTGTLAFKCEWKDCSTRQQSLAMLSKHVQDHLQHLYNMDSDVNPPLEDQISWRDRYEVLKDAYHSLQVDISKLRDLVSQGDVQIHDSNMLYQKSLKASIMYSKRLEARMEWEQTKWHQYAELKATMEKRASGCIPFSGDSSNADLPIVDDKMESLNTVQEIHQLLTRAKEEQEILSEKNASLYQERQTLSVECKRIQESCDAATSRLQELEAKHMITTDELKRRTANVETLRVTMEQKREQTQATIEQLQSKIGELMSSPMQQESFTQNSSKPPIDSISFQTKYDGRVGEESCKDVIHDNDDSTSDAHTSITSLPPVNSDAPLLSTTPSSDPNNFINMLTKSTPQ